MTTFLFALAWLGACIVVALWAAERVACRVDAAVADALADDWLDLYDACHEPFTAADQSWLDQCGMQS